MINAAECIAVYPQPMARNMFFKALSSLRLQTMMTFNDLADLFKSCARRSQKQIVYSHCENAIANKLSVQLNTTYNLTKSIINERETKKLRRIPNIKINKPPCITTTTKQNIKKREKMRKNIICKR